MAKYVDLVLVATKEHKYIVQAPSGSRLADGDEVMTETIYGTRRATVVDCCEWVEMDGDVYKFVLECLGESTPLKRVVNKVDYIQFKYEEEV